MAKTSTTPLMSLDLSDVISLLDKQRLKTFNLLGKPVAVEITPTNNEEDWEALRRLAHQRVKAIQNEGEDPDDFDDDDDLGLDDEDDFDDVEEEDDEGEFDY